MDLPLARQSTALVG